MLRHVNGGVEITGRTAARTDLALAGESDLVALVYAGGDGDADLLAALDAPVAAAGGAGRDDDPAVAVAAGAGRDVDHLAEHRVADAPDLASSTACGAGGRRAAGRRTTAGAGQALVQQIELEFLLDALDGFVESNAEVVAQVRSG